MSTGEPRSTAERWPGKWDFMAGVEIFETSSERSYSVLWTGRVEPKNAQVGDSWDSPKLGLVKKTETGWV